MNKLRLAVLAVMLGTSAMSQAANLVTNGSFEADSIGNQAWAYLNSVTGWTSTGLFEIQKGNDNGGYAAFNSSYDGIQYLELNSTTLTTVSQTLNTVAGQGYTLSFAFSGRSDTPNLLKSALEVYWNGTKLSTFKANAKSDWIEVSIDAPLFATSSQTVLSFKSIAPVAAPSYGSYLDAVNVSAVPEPSTYAMMALGLGLLGFAARRRSV